jgi:O-succinylbenzoic acid--CoA ligase
MDGMLRGSLTAEAEDFLKEWSNSLRYVVAHTSGSTGTPKEIRLLKSDMVLSAQATVDFFGITADSTLYLPLSPSYIAGKMQIVRALVAGCHLDVVPPSNQPLGDGLSCPVDLLPVVPSQIPGLLSSPSLQDVRNVIIGGAPVSPEAESELLARGVEGYATYGMTETCSHVALRKLGISSFRALPGFSFSVDSRGCLVITSGSMSFGSLVTNDIVELVSEREFVWKGRFDNVINSGGIKIFPEEIERVIAPLLPATGLFYVTSRRSERWGEEAVIVTDCEKYADDSSEGDALLSALRELLPPHHLPKAVIYEPSIALTSSKKIVRRRLG